MRKKITNTQLKKLIRVKLAKLNWDRKTFAQLIGATEPQVSWWISGRHLPNAASMRKILLFLDTDKTLLQLALRLKRRDENGAKRAG